MKDINGGALGTTTLVYRPLSAQSALSQSGAVRPGETAMTATYYNPRQHVDVPESLVDHILPGFMGARREMLRGAGKGKERLTERGTLDLIEYLRYVLVRGAVELQEELPNNWLFQKVPLQLARVFGLGTSRAERDLPSPSSRRQVTASLPGITCDNQRAITPTRQGEWERCLRCQAEVELIDTGF